MADGIVVQVRGVRELRKALREIEDKATSKGMASELRAEFKAAARVVEIAAREEAPKRSGRLAGSIKARGTTTGGQVVAGGLKAVPYAAPIHWGWPSRPNKSRGWRGGPIAPNRFLVRAAERSQAQVAEAIEGGLRRWIDKVADTNG